MAEMNANRTSRHMIIRHRGRGAQVGIYFGKMLRMFIYQNDWKVLPMAALIAGLVGMVIRNRLFITIPLLLVGGGLTWFATVNDNGFQIIWRYFSWSNQTLAMIALWVATAYLVRRGKQPLCSLITAIPAAFMSAVSTTYILTAQEGFRLSTRIAYPVGIAVAAGLFLVYCVQLRRSNHPERQIS